MDDVISAIDIIMSKPLTAVIDIGTGVSNRLVDIADYFKIDYLKMIGDETERLDNTADTTILNSLNWITKVNLYQYIEENKNVN